MVQQVTLLVAKDSAATSESRTTPVTHLLLWLLLVVTSCLFGNIEAEPSVGWILPPNGAPRFVCDALDLGSDTGWCQLCWGSPPTPCQEPVTAAGAYPVTRIPKGLTL